MTAPPWPKLAPSIVLKMDPVNSVRNVQITKRKMNKATSFPYRERQQARQRRQ